MGQKVNPFSLRLVNKKNWQSRWFTKNNYSSLLQGDFWIRKSIENKVGISAGVAKVEIERDAEKVSVVIYTSRPGVLIGRAGQGINDLKAYLERELEKKTKQVFRLKIDIIEIRNPDLWAPLVAQSIGYQISKRVHYKKAVRQAVEKTIKARALGVKILVSGRLNGAEIARKEKFQEGSIPLSNLNKEIDYAVYHAFTTYGIIGIKVWIYKKEEEENQ